MWCAKATFATTGLLAHRRLTGRRRPNFASRCPAGAEAPGGLGLSLRFVVRHWSSVEALIVPWLFLALVSAPIAAWYADRRQRSALVWLAYGAVLGPVALGILWVSPPGACPECGAGVVGWASECEECGASLDEGAAFESLREGPSPAEVGARSAAASGAVHALPSTGAETGPRGTGGIGGAVGAIRPAPAGRRRGVSVMLGQGSREPATVLATGIFTGGSLGLEIGGRYGLGRLGEEFVALGPVDTVPDRIAARIALRKLTIAGIENQVVLSSLSRRQRLVLTFQRLSGMSPAELEQELGSVAPSPDRGARLVAVGPGRDDEPADQEPIPAARRSGGGPAA